MFDIIKIYHNYSFNYLILFLKYILVYVGICYKITFINGFILYISVVNLQISNKLSHVKLK